MVGALPWRVGLRLLIERQAVGATDLLTYILRRFLYSIPVLVAASFLIFTFTVTTADPLSELREVRNVNQQAIALITKEKHLDDPVIVRYGYWVKDAVTNRFGTTIFG